MNKNKIIIKVDDVTSLLCCAPSIRALKQRFTDHNVGIWGDPSLKEMAPILPDIDFFQTEHAPIHDVNDQIYYLGTNTVSEHGTENSNWRSYLSCLSHTTCGNPLHKIDLYKKVVALDTTQENYELSPIIPEENNLQQTLTEYEGSHLRIGLCIASLTEDELSAICAALDGTPFSTAIFLLGTIKDKKASSHLTKSYSHIFHDLCGKISLRDHAYIAQNIDLMICGTGLSALLSSGYGTFTICIDSNHDPLYYPYGHGHLIIQPYNSGSKDILKSLLSESIIYTVTGNSGNVPSIEQWQGFFDERIDVYLENIRISITQRVEKISQETTLELYTKPLIYLGAEYIDLIQSFYRLLLEYSFQSRVLSADDLQILHQDTIPALRQTLAPLEQLYEIANFGRTYCKHIKDDLLRQDLAKAKENSARLQDVDNMIQTLGSTYEGLSLLCLLHQERQLLLTEENPIELANKMSSIFSDLQSNVLVFLDLAKTLFHTNIEQLQEGISHG